MKRKILVVVMTLLMVATMVPSMAFANTANDFTEVTTQQEFQDAVDKGENVKLMDDINLTSPIRIDENMNISVDGNDKTIKLPGAIGAFNGKGGLDGLNGRTVLNVTNLNFEGPDNTQTGYAVIVGFEADGVSVTLSDCTFTNMWDAVYCNPVTDANAQPSSIDISGKFTNVAYVYSIDNGATPGARVDKHFISTYTESDDNLQQEESFAVASVDGVGFKDYASAIEAVTNALEIGEDAILTIIKANEGEDIGDVPEGVYVDNQSGATIKVNGEEMHPVTWVSYILLTPDLKDDDTQENWYKIGEEWGDAYGSVELPLINSSATITADDIPDVANSEYKFDGYRFVGWFKAEVDDEGNIIRLVGDKLTANTKISGDEDNVYYAKWEKVEETTIPTTPSTPAAGTTTPTTDNVVQTGDDFNMTIPFVLAGLALAGMAVAVATRKRHN